MQNHNSVSPVARSSEFVASQYTVQTHFASSFEVKAVKIVVKEYIRWAERSFARLEVILSSGYIIAFRASPGLKMILSQCLFFGSIAEWQSVSFVDIFLLLVHVIKKLWHILRTKIFNFIAAQASDNKPIGNNIASRLLFEYKIVKLS